MVPRVFSQLAEEVGVVVGAARPQWPLARGSLGAARDELGDGSREGEEQDDEHPDEFRQPTHGVLVGADAVDHAVDRQRQRQDDGQDTQRAPIIRR